MNSLDKMGNSNAEEWFPLAKGKKTASPPPAPVVQPTQPVVVPPSVSSPPAEPIPHPSSQTTVEGSQAINKTSVSSSFATPSTEKPSKRHRLLLIPMALTLMMALVSIVFKALNLSFISRGAETVIYLMLALLSSLGFIGLTLYYLGELRERYIFSASAQPISTKDIFVAAIFFVVWPVLLAILSAVIFILFLGDETMLGTINGLSTALFLTTPLTVTLAIILFWVLSIYKKTTLIPYPPYVPELIGFVWEKLK